VLDVVRLCSIDERLALFLFDVLAKDFPNYSEAETVAHCGTRVLAPEEAFSNKALTIGHGVYAVYTMEGGLDALRLLEVC
jgi:hypothetical protein